VAIRPPGGKKTMITKQRTLFYFVGEQAFPSLEAAQIADLNQIIPDQFVTEPGDRDIKESIARWMLKNSAEIVDCLTTTPRSRMRGRKLHGATRKPRSDKGGTHKRIATEPAPVTA
jgi:hypothetical protein